MYKKIIDTNQRTMLVFFPSKQMFHFKASTDMEYEMVDYLVKNCNDISINMEAVINGDFRFFVVNDILVSMLNSDMGVEDVLNSHGKTIDNIVRARIRKAESLVASAYLFDDIEPELHKYKSCGFFEKDEEYESGFEFFDGADSIARPPSFFQ